MIKAFKLLILMFLVTAFSACGNRKAPTGGRVDTENPVIVAIIPEQFSDITGQNIEITFSKPIDRSSIYEGERGVLFYPQINNKKFRWSDNTLTIEINEELIPDKNYYLTLSKQIRDLRRNNLDKDYLFVFHTGELQNYRIYGDITYELTEDLGKPVILSLLSADSLRIFRKEITGRNYALENLNRNDYILRAFIDKNSNLRYDKDSEPFFEKSLSVDRNLEIALSLDYVDTTPPAITAVRSEFEHLVHITFNKPLRSLGEFFITSLDTLAAPLQIRDFDLLGNTMEIITNPMDSLQYSLTLFSVTDHKGNVAQELRTDFVGNPNRDQSRPQILSTTPRNGSVVNNLLPSLTITFNKFMSADYIVLRLVDTITGENIPYHLQRDSSRQFTIQPKNNLTNRTPYILEILDSSNDMPGNELGNTNVLQFLPISSDF